jgi:hypothetical protein
MKPASANGVVEGMENRSLKNSASQTIDGEADKQHAPRSLAGKRNGREKKQEVIQAASGEGKPP